MIQPTLPSTMPPKLCRALVLFPTAVALALASLSPAPAARLKPPSEAIKEPQNTVAVVEVVELRPDGSGILDALELLHGDSAQKIDARDVAAGPEPLAIGDRRIMVYSSLQKSQRVRNAFERDPAGPRIIDIPSVGYAILEDSAPMRVLATDPPDNEPLTDAAILQAILAQVERPHIQSRRFVLSELVLRPGLLQMIDEEGLVTLKQVLLSGSLEPLANDYLIRALLPLASDKRVQPWLRAGCLEVLTSRGTDLEPLSFEPALVKVAAVALGRSGSPLDVEVLARHLGSTNPGVARESWESILQLDRVAAPDIAQRALKTSVLQPDVRSALEQYLERILPSGDPGTF